MSMNGIEDHGLLCQWIRYSIEAGVAFPDMLVEHWSISDLPLLLLTLFATPNNNSTLSNAPAWRAGWERRIRKCSGVD
jgi:hypothetical protein